jgi:signal transduction histidine kinase
MITYLGQNIVEMENIDFAEHVRMNLPVLQERKPPNVNVGLELPSPGPVIKADVRQIQQILINLVINAFESIGDRAGTVHLRVKTVSSTDIPASHRFPADWTVNDHSYACLRVMDSGCGMRKTDFDKLFEPFFSTKSIGRGLGLPVVLGIVRSHNGGITVEAGNGGGSVFSVFFPLSV